MKQYLDIQGEVHEQWEVDNHHVFPQCKALGRLATKFINQRGLKLPMLKIYHNEGEQSLHANVRFPIMPNPELMNLVNDYTAGLASQNAFDRFLYIADYFDRLREAPNIGIAEQADKIADNIQLQAPYILEGQVRLHGSV